MWQRKSVEITVGLFVLMGILSLLVMALKVSGLNTAYQEENGYPIAVLFNNAGGLKAKAKVTIAGVAVGRVKSIQLNQDFIARVDLWIHPNVQLPEDTRASILTAGLLGDNYIGLAPGFSETNLKEGGMIPETQTDSAVVLEDLISRFVSNQATETKKNESSQESDKVNEEITPHHNQE